MKKLIMLLCLIWIVLFSTLSFPAPYAPCTPVTIEGTIEEISWTPSQFAQGRPGSWGSARHDRTFPAHYKLKLVDSTTTPVNDRGGPPYCGHADRLQINHNEDDRYLQQGMRIKVTDYKSGGDEGGIWTSYATIEFIY